MTVHPFQLDRALDAFIGTALAPPVQRAQYMQVSNETAYVINAPMIGVTKADLTVNVVDNNLVVSAAPSVKSRWSNDFKQTWILNEDADTANISAKLENGLLILTIPRIKPAKRTVNVTVQ
jgi:HSP20 family protein